MDSDQAAHGSWATIRGYTSPKQDAYGIALATKQGDFGRDFYTAFDDGSSVVTSTYPGQTHLPSKKVFRANHSARDFSELYVKHNVAVEQRRTQVGATPRPVGRSLEGLASTIDEFLVRFTS